MINNIRHIFFDLDNTLWDHRKNAKLTLQNLFGEYEIQTKFNLGFDEFHAEYFRINEELWAKLRDEEIDKAYLRKHRFYDTFLHFGIDDFELSQQFEHRFLDEIVVYNEVVPGTNEILGYLKKKNYQLHIITNGFREVTHRKIEGSKIGHYFTTVTSADEVGVRKPNPKIFQHCLNISGAKLEESILIGDDWIADVEGAKSFGMEVIFFDVFNEFPNAETKLIRELKEIENFL